MPQDITNSEDYYEGDPYRHGEYQYVTLEDVINNFIMGRDEDDYTSSTPRYKVLYQARRGMRELYYDVVREIRAIELELSPNLNITLPPQDPSACIQIFPPCLSTTSLILIKLSNAPSTEVPIVACIKNGVFPNFYAYSICLERSSVSISPFGRTSTY